MAKSKISSKPKSDSPFEKFVSDTNATIARFNKVLSDADAAVARFHKEEPTEKHVLKMAKAALKEAKKVLHWVNTHEPGDSYLAASPTDDAEKEALEKELEWITTHELDEPYQAESPAGSAEEEALEKELEWITTHELDEPYQAASPASSAEEEALEKELEWITTHGLDEPYPGTSPTNSMDDDELMRELDQLREDGEGKDSGIGASPISSSGNGSSDSSSLTSQSPAQFTDQKIFKGKLESLKNSSKQAASEALKEGDDEPDAVLTNSI